MSVTPRTDVLYTECYSLQYRIEAQSLINDTLWILTDSYNFVTPKIHYLYRGIEKRHIVSLVYLICLPAQPFCRS